jgi:hypothetical protein
MSGARVRQARESISGRAEFSKGEISQVSKHRRGLRYRIADDRSFVLEEYLIVTDQDRSDHLAPD